MIPDVQSLTVKQVDTLETLSIYLPNCQITTVSVQSWTQKSSCENVLPCLPLCGQYGKLDFGWVKFILWLVHILPLLLITHGGIVSSLWAKYCLTSFLIVCAVWTPQRCAEIQHGRWSYQNLQKHTFDFHWADVHNIKVEGNIIYLYLAYLKSVWYVS